MNQRAEEGHRDLILDATTDLPECLGAIRSPLWASLIRGLHGYPKPAWSSDPGNTEISQVLGHCIQPSESVPWNDPGRYLRLPTGIREHLGQPELQGIWGFWWRGGHPGCPVPSAHPPDCRCSAGCHLAPVPREQHVCVQAWLRGLQSVTTAGNNFFLTASRRSAQGARPATPW